MIKTGLCACKYCKPMKFCTKGIWILREINHEYQTDTIYAVCREYYSEKLNIYRGVSRTKNEYKLHQKKLFY